MKIVQIAFDIDSFDETNSFDTTMFLLMDDGTVYCQRRDGRFHKKEIVFAVEAEAK